MLKHLAIRQRPFGADAAPKGRCLIAQSFMTGRIRRNTSKFLPAVVPALQINDDEFARKPVVKVG